MADAIPHGVPCLADGTGRIAKPAVPRHLRRCTLCGTRALGDERHCVFDGPVLPTFVAVSVVVSRC